MPPTGKDRASSSDEVVASMENSIKDVRSELAEHKEYIDAKFEAKFQAFTAHIEARFDAKFQALTAHLESLIVQKSQNNHTNPNISMLNHLLISLFPNPYLNPPLF
ncbi:OLC1v1031432C1 [Oldenlandia corymbosa var. corymbosa]|uniref:OLC1v1031432C1 n=1 Tax=Oldenlandia corymbosa var. corymbosa TaxID=529605 RepID=A0AAV1CIH1_OLDCO|nr:OLC1v1031432C1 [Oldenlandia corymbosa var. corymbosa]